MKPSKLFLFNIETEEGEFSVVAPNKEAAIEAFEKEHPWHEETIHAPYVRKVAGAKGLLKEYKKQQGLYKRNCKHIKKKIAFYKQEIKEAKELLKTYSNIVIDWEDCNLEFEHKIEQAKKLLVKQ